MTVLVFDPGESTGFVKVANRITGGTIVRDRAAIWQLLLDTQPDILVFETFRLYKNHAQSLINNTFYTCEIIGIFKLYCALHPETKLVEQGASVKKYSNARSTDGHWELIKQTPGQLVTDHTFDAYMHWCYYRRTTNGQK